MLRYDGPPRVMGKVQMAASNGSEHVEAMDEGATAFLLRVQLASRVRPCAETAEHRPSEPGSRRDRGPAVAE